MYYRHDTIRTVNDRTVHLKFIESFSQDTTGLDVTFDKLKGDTILSIRTISGAEYSVSINAVLIWLGEDPSASLHKDMIRAIHEQWSRILHKD